MIFSLIIGILLGALSVIFVLQNVAIVTVAFLSYQFTASLALILFATLIAGVVVTLLMLLPNVIKDSFYVKSLKRRIKEVEDENMRIKQPVRPVVVETPATVL